MPTTSRESYLEYEGGSSSLEFKYLQCSESMKRRAILCACLLLHLAAASCTAPASPARAHAAVKEGLERSLSALDRRTRKSIFDAILTHAVEHLASGARPTAPLVLLLVGDRAATATLAHAACGVRRALAQLAEVRHLALNASAGKEKRLLDVRAPMNEFLGACPRGIVVVHELDALPTAEAFAFKAYCDDTGGSHFPAAAYIFTLVAEDVPSLAPTSGVPRRARVADILTHLLAKWKSDSAATSSLVSRISQSVVHVAAQPSAAALGCAASASGSGGGSSEAAAWWAEQRLRLLAGCSLALAIAWLAGRGGGGGGSRSGSDSDSGGRIDRIAGGSRSGSDDAGPGGGRPALRRGGDMARRSYRELQALAKAAGIKTGSSPTKKSLIDALSNRAV